MSSSSRVITCSLLFLLSENNNQVLSLINKPGFYHRRSTATPLNRVAPLRFTGDIGVDLYDAQLTVSQFVETQLATASPTSIAFLYGAGLLTAFSPCSISLLPLTLAYLGGSESTKSNEVVEDKADKTVLTRAALYASGLATTLTLFGLSAAMLGNVFGASGLIGDLSALLSSGLFLVMGLYLLGIVEIEFPSFNGKIGKGSNKDSNDGFFSSSSVQAFLFGATSALVASPCSSPVLTSLLAFVASSGDATIGAGILVGMRSAIFLFTYSLGYATPVVLASALSTSALGGALKGQGATWANSAFASLLIFYGTYTTFENVSKIFML